MTESESGKIPLLYEWSHDGCRYTDARFSLDLLGVQRHGMPALSTSCTLLPATLAHFQDTYHARYILSVDGIEAASF
jgi:hypothetical protein